MTSSRRVLLIRWTYIALSLVLLTWLIWQARDTFAALTWGEVLAALVFGGINLFTAIFGVPFLGGGYISLSPMAAMATYLILGALPAAWVIFTSEVLYSVVRYLNWEKLEPDDPRPAWQEAFRRTLVNAFMQTTSLLAGHWAFSTLGEQTPAIVIGWRQVLPLLAFSAAYLVTNYVLVSGQIYIISPGDEFTAYLRSIPRSFTYELLPMLFAPLIAQVYLHLGWGDFLVLLVAIGIASLMMRRLSLTSQRLQRRVAELSGLQAVGQALSSSLDLNEILQTIYRQTIRLMPADNFYIALYDSEHDEVTFPIAFEEGKPVELRARRAGNSLTEYILRSQKPLLLRENIGEHVERLGVKRSGRPAKSWLGVPILAGNTSLGVIALQSFTTPRLYDESHLEILMTIASQAAIAIQNARLYSRTDEALAQRVSELNSILATTSEGILLLDNRWDVVAANPAISRMVGIAESDLLGCSLATYAGESQTLQLLTQLGYTVHDLQTECQELTQTPTASRRKIIRRSEPAEAYYERTLTPVCERSPQQTIIGWLLVFRDVTEETALARLRDEMTHMLIHDLRSPLVSIKGSLDMIADGEREYLEDLVDLGRRGVDRMLNMVNQLLDINRLESQRLPIHPQACDVNALASDVVGRLAYLATAAQIHLQVDLPYDLPPLWVDPDLMTRVLYNLVDNAIKFTPDGGTVRLWARRDPKDPEKFLWVAVSDTGPGIPPEAQERLFKKFQQVLIQGRRKGTGLGLPFCKLAVEAHGGDIWVDSPKGGGTTFVCRLPISLSTDAAH